MNVEIELGIVRQGDEIERMHFRRVLEAVSLAVRDLVMSRLAVDAVKYHVEGGAVADDKNPLARIFLVYVIYRREHSPLELCGAFHARLKAVALHAGLYVLPELAFLLLADTVLAEPDVIDNVLGIKTARLGDDSGGFLCSKEVRRDDDVDALPGHLTCAIGDLSPSLFGKVILIWHL